MKYNCDFSPEYGDVGKVILYVKDDEVHLGGLSTQLWANLIKNYEAGEKNFLSNKSGKDAVLDSLITLPLQKKVGLHKDIPYEGKVLGGSQYAIGEGKMYLSSYSTDFGQIHPEAVEKCIEGLGLELVFKERDMSGESLEEYLEKKLK